MVHFETNDIHGRPIKLVTIEIVVLSFTNKAISRWNIEVFQILVRFTFTSHAIFIYILSRIVSYYGYIHNSEMHYS